MRIKALINAHSAMATRYSDLVYRVALAAAEDASEHGLEAVKNFIAPLHPDYSIKVPLPLSTGGAICPECGGPILALDLNKAPDAMVPGFASYVGCNRFMDCGWGIISKAPVAEIIMEMRRCAMEKQPCDFSRFDDFRPEE